MDITLEEELKKSPFFFLMINSISEMIFVFDKDKKIKFVNNAVKKFLEKKSGEVLIESFYDQYVNCSVFNNKKSCGYEPFCSSCFILENIDEVLNKKSEIKDKEGIIKVFKDKDIETIYVVISAVLFEIRKEEYVVMTMRDISEIKNYEIERIKELEKLSIIGAAASSIVHDIKNPLTGITGYLYILEKNINNNLHRGLFSKMENSLIRIKNMLEEILNVASGKSEILIEKQEVNYSEFIENFLKDLSINSSINKKILFKDKVFLDKEKFLHVLWNIFKNADEAMINKNEKIINIEVYTKDNKLITSIEDKGDGIPFEIKDKLFKPGKSFGKKDGKGFGLFGVKRIVEAHGGEIYFENSQGKGAIFYIELPLYDK